MGRADGMCVWEENEIPCVLFMQVVLIGLCCSGLVGSGAFFVVCVCET